MKNINIIIIIVSLSLAMAGCTKTLDIGPPATQLVPNTVFTDNSSANAAVTGLYSQLGNLAGAFNNGATVSGVHIPAMAGLSADELLYIPNTNFDQFSKNAIPVNDPSIAAAWKSVYNIIYNANAIIEGLQQHAGVSAAYQQQLTGEAKFLRAYSYFYLTNLFGAVPLVTTTQVHISSTLPRSAEASIYAQIVADLTDARASLVTDYSFSGAEKVRVNKHAATALLARIYLYQQNWVQAEAMATEVINAGVYSLLSDLNEFSLKNNRETIWQIWTRGFTYEGRNLYATNTALFVLTPNLISSFEVADRRRTDWTRPVLHLGQTYYQPYKYRVITDAGNEYVMALRLAEQYLIRAEARAQQNSISGAQQDLNVIRNRANLSNTAAADKNSLLLAIEQERRVEFLAEWGHRWFDLKRTGRADNILAAFKPANWQSFAKLFPVPFYELQTNPALAPQNPGY